MVDGTAFLNALDVKAKMYAKAARDAYQSNIEVTSWLLNPLAKWAENAYGSTVFENAARGYAQYCMHVAQAHHKYVREGRYTPQDLPDIIKSVYEDSGYMTPYMWAAILIYPFWSSMIEHIRLFKDFFLPAVVSNGNILELACGHGVIGLTALEYRKDVNVAGFDISPSAIEIAQKLSFASGHSSRANFQVKDVLKLDSQVEGKCYDAIIAAMLAEHLEDPRPLFASIARNLAPGGVVYFSTAIESPQCDHIYEFHKESEPLLMAEAEGLRVIRMVCDSGLRIPESPFLPRACAMILKKV
jgi:2-polyprenyl-3-methyl-5-hydroxy-6-metoxy-1,4-benzoquinol methylase